MNWVDRFVAKNGRKPRVLHIGNIANNAYLNSKILNGLGIDSDVMCGPYYHIMGYPHWEDADFSGDWGDDFNPDWNRAGAASFKSPIWFAQGPYKECITLLVERYGEKNRSGMWLPVLVFIMRVSCYLHRRVPVLRRVLDFFNRHVLLMFYPQDVVKSVESGSCRTADMCSIIRQCGEIMSMRKLISLYDVVIGYATAGAIPLDAGKRPYCAFEHGTIRKLPFEDTVAGRQCAEVYKRADYCFITNCDNITAARRLGLQNYTFIPHPVNEDIMVEQESERLREDLRRELRADFILFHPPRQHWEAKRDPDWEKGNDYLIRGFADFVKTVDPRGAAVFVDWGLKVEESKALLIQLGVADRVKWVRPLPNVQMIKYVKATDALADQFFLGAFGSTMPKALLHGSPALIYLDEERHRWCFPELPPVLNVRTPEEICEALKRLYLDTDFRNDLVARGRIWYEKYHSNAVIGKTFLGVFEKICGK